MTCWAIVPVKAPEQSKTRLRAVMTDAERTDLVSRLLRHVIGTIRGTPSVAETCLLGPPHSGDAFGLTTLDDPGRDLNAALAGALRHIDENVTRLIILPADLPQLTGDDVDALADADHETICIAPDRAGAGTNGLSLPLPAARNFAFHFGPGSFAQHRRECDRLGLNARIVRSDGLELDVDEPADLRAASLHLARFTKEPQ